MTSPEKLREPIVIAGGGIGGLCLAAALTQRKIPWGGNRLAQ